MRRSATLVFWFFLLFYVLTNSYRPIVQIPDEEYILHVTSALVTEKSLALPESMPKYAGAVDRGDDGKFYSSYQIGQSLIYAPFYFLGKNLFEAMEPYDQALHGGYENYETFIEVRTRRFLFLWPAFAVAAGVTIFFLILLSLGYSTRVSVITTGLFGLGSMAWPYSRYLLTEATQLPLFLFVIYSLMIQKKQDSWKPRWMVAAGGAFGLLLSIRAILLLALPLLVIYWFWEKKERQKVFVSLLYFGIPMALFFVPQLIYDQIRFSNPLQVGYGGAKFSTPVWVGLYGYFLSAGKSIFLYSPLALLAFPSMRAFLKRAGTEGYLFLTLILLVAVAYARWWIWSGDPAWGPRYLLVILPFFFLPVAHFVEDVLKSEKSKDTSLSIVNLWKKPTLVTLFIVSLAIQALACSAHYLQYHAYVRRAASLIPRSEIVVSPKTESGFLPIRDRYLDIAFIPEYSPIAGQWWMVRTLLLGNYKNASASAPWAGLGITQFHEEIPLRVEWDWGLARLIRAGFNWDTALLYAFSLIGLLVLIILGKKLWRETQVGET